MQWANVYVNNTVHFLILKNKLPVVYCDDKCRNEHPVSKDFILNVLQLNCNVLMLNIFSVLRTVKMCGLPTVDYTKVFMVLIKLKLVG